ncbi:MAG: exopolysaccharide biosynthesis protein [Desulfosudaceae bacterium]
MSEAFTNLTQLLDRIKQATDGQKSVSLDLIVRIVGTESFGPLLLLIGVILFSPVSGIPGVPTLSGVIILTTAVQLLLGRRRFWLPQWLRRRRFSQKKLDRALRRLRRPAYFIDRRLQPRLTILTHGPGIILIVVFCVVIAAAMPAMELVPFSATTAGAALIVFGLSLIANDGLLALLAMVFTGLAFSLILSHVL